MCTEIHADGKEIGTVAELRAFLRERGQESAMKRNPFYQGEHPLDEDACLCQIAVPDTLRAAGLTFNEFFPDLFDVELATGPEGA